MGSLPLIADTADLEEVARRVRVEIVRAVAATGGGHIGGDLSSTDILVALYFRAMKVRPSEPTWADRDRFVLSKGHAALALYATMAIRGYFDLSEMETFCRIDSRLQGHPDMTRLPGIEISTGSLGLGISAAVGMALGAKLKGSEQRVYTLLGDGESQEGSVWEAAFIAARYDLDNLVAITDVNGLQQYGWPAPVTSKRRAPVSRDELGNRWRAFGWHVIEANGNDMQSLLDALDAAGSSRELPTAIIASTIKGRGVPFTEGDWQWHGKGLTADEARQALRALGEEGAT